MKIQEGDFHFELAKATQRELIQQWLGQKHVRKILNQLKLKNVLSHLDQFFQGKSPF